MAPNAQVARLIARSTCEGVLRGFPSRPRSTHSGSVSAQPVNHDSWVLRQTGCGLRLHLRRHLGRRRLRRFVINASVRRIVGWRVSRTAHAGFVLDALEQALHDRQPIRRAGLIHHSDRGVQYVSLRYTQRLAEAGIEPSVGSVGDWDHNALAETINGLFKAEVIHRCGPWRSFEAVEFATLEWVDWFNNRRLLEPIGNIPPAEAEARYYAMLEQSAMAA